MTASVPITQRQFLLTGSVLTAVWLALHGAYFLGTPIYDPPDTGCYEWLASILRGQEVFPQDGMHWPPGYAFAIAGLQTVLGGSYSHGLVVVQHLGVLLAALMLLDLGNRQGYPRVGLLAAVLTVCSPVLMTWCQTLYTEIFTSVLLVAILWCSARTAGSTRPLLWAVGAGIAIAAAGLLRQAPYILAIPVSAYFFIVRRQFDGWHRVAIPVLPVAVAALVFCSWSGYTLAKTGRFEHSSGGGRHVYNRVVHSDRTLDSDGKYTKELLTLIREDEAYEPHWNVYEQLKDRGLSSPRANRLMTRVSIESIMHNPVKYAVNTIRLLIRYWFIEPDRLTESERSPAPIPAIGSALKPLITLLVYCTSHRLVGGLGLVATGVALFGKGKALVRLAVAITVLYLLIHAAAEWISCRFGIPVYPLLAYLAAWGLLWGGAWLANRGRGGNSPVLE